MKRQNGEADASLQYFINFKPVTPKADVKNIPGQVLNALCSFQYHHATEQEETYTVLDPANGIAFTQRYAKLQGGGCIHSHMWKHEPGVKNPDSPSFDELLARHKALTHCRVCTAILESRGECSNADCPTHTNTEDWDQYNIPLAFAAYAQKRSLKPLSTGGNVDYVMRPLTNKQGPELILMPIEDAGCPDRLDEPCKVMLSLASDWTETISFSFPDCRKGMDFMAAFDEADVDFPGWKGDQ